MKQAENKIRNSKNSTNYFSNDKSRSENDHLPGRKTTTPRAENDHPQGGNYTTTIISNTNINNTNIGTDEKTCPKCNGIGFIISGKPGNETATKCECRKEKELMEQLEQSGIKKAFFDKKINDIKTLNNSEIRKAKQLIINYIRANDDSSLLISGRSGTGKTHLAIATLKALFEKGRRIKYIGYHELTNKLKGFAIEPEKREKELLKYQKIEVLLIDDLFKESRTEAGVIRGITPADIRIIYEVINYRYNNNLKTIITTELIPSKLAEIDEAITGRIIEMAGNNMIIFRNVDNYRFRGEAR